MVGSSASSDSVMSDAFLLSPDVEGSASGVPTDPADADRPAPDAPDADGPLDAS